MRRLLPLFLLLFTFGCQKPAESETAKSADNGAVPANQGGGVAPLTSGATGMTPVTGGESVEGAGMGGVGQAAKGAAQKAAAAASAPAGSGGSPESDQ